jgi:NAD(P)-dependent dehydrogenase (short-subunit alcohol dehydrogenase family)
MNNLAGRQVLVTGAAMGIGLECARTFARRGAHLVVCDLNGPALESVRAEIAASGAPCIAHACDVASEESVLELAAAVHAKVGPLDILVNNAGVAYLGSFEETPLREWRRIHDINVMGVVHCIRSFLPAMRAAGGGRKIVHVSPTSSGMSAEQVQRLHRYYETDGCHPAVVAGDILRSVENGAGFLFTGPLAKLGYAGMRVSRRLARRFAIATAKKSGYLAA